MEPQSYKIFQTYVSYSRRMTTMEALVNITCTPPYSVFLFLENTTRNPWEPLKWNFILRSEGMCELDRLWFLQQYCYKWTLAQPAIMKIMFSLFWNLENLCMYVCEYILYVFNLCLAWCFRVLNYLFSRKCYCRLLYSTCNNVFLTRKHKLLLLQV